MEINRLMSNLMLKLNIVTKWCVCSPCIVAFEYMIIITCNML